MHGDVVKGIGKGAHGVLLEAWGTRCGVFDGERTCDLGGTTTVYDAVIADEVTNHAEGVMQGALGLIDDLGVVSALYALDNADTG